MSWLSEAVHHIADGPIVAGMHNAAHQAITHAQQDAATNPALQKQPLIALFVNAALTALAQLFAPTPPTSP